jgi:hypothetical protein
VSRNGVGDWERWKGQDLVTRSCRVVSEEILAQQACACRQEVVEDEAENRGEAIILVEAHSMAVSDEDEQDVELQLTVIEAGPETISEKPVRDEGE